MKKNNLFLLAFAACTLLLGACSTELETSDNPHRVGDNEALVAVSLQFPQGDTPAGYAAGDLGDDVLPGVALPVEKEIRSIAFIAFTKGGTSIYLSQNPTLTENGFTEPLTPKVENAHGEYTAQFKIKSADFDGNTTIVAVANYAEHGLTFNGQTLTLDGLKQMLSDELLDQADKNFIDYPLLMTMAHEQEIVEGSTVPIAFVMERIMARVDVVNNAYDQTTTENNFVLTSAQLLSAPSQGTMIASQNVAPSGYIDLLEYDVVSVIAPADGNAVSPTNPAKQQLAPMYVYENSNTDETDATKLSTTATYVLVKGTYKGKAYEKKVEFRTLEKIENNELGVPEKVGGVIVPIVRNTRYVVEINSSTEGEPEFDVKVTDWAEGEQLDVEIDFAEPVLDGLDNIAPANGATWDVAAKTLNITAATDATNIEFAVRGYQDTDFRMEAEYDQNVANPLVGTIAVTRSDLSGYADASTEEEAPLNRTYKVTIPTYTGECPSLTKIIVYNAAYPDAKTEITVKYAPVFVGDIKSQGAAINPSTMLVDLKNVTNGQSGTVSFFASASAELATTITNKGLTNDFYTLTTAEETDIDLKSKFGPGKRVTVSYNALTDIPEWAEVSVAETGATASSTVKKLFVKCLKKTCFASAVFSLNTNNALATGQELFLAVNNGEHGTIDYTVYDDASNTITLDPTATYSGGASSAWIQGVTKSSDEIAETYSNFQIVKRTVKVSLPNAIKSPAQATNFKVGVNTSAAATLTLTPVYLSGAAIAERDKAFRPVLVKAVWWSPINIGQTKISKVNDPSTDCGNLFQWGRKQALTWNSSKQAGPVDSAGAAGTNFITNSNSPNDWLTSQNNQLWNSGGENSPTKADNDPCPAGWRVPTEAEWNSSLVGSDGHTWAAGGASASSNGLLTVVGNSGNSLYFPAAGRLSSTGSVSSQGAYGYYWASAVNGSYARYVYFNSATVSVSYNSRAFGMPVRCVQDL